MVWAETIISLIRALQPLPGSAATSHAFLWMGVMEERWFGARGCQISWVVFFRQGVNRGHSPSVCRWVCCRFAWPGPVLLISANPLVPLGPPWLLFTLLLSVIHLYLTVNNAKDPGLGVSDTQSSASLGEQEGAEPQLYLCIACALRLTGGWLLQRLVVGSHQCAA